MLASEGLGRGQTADHPFPFPTTSLLASLETFLFGPRRFFTPFPPYAEPGPRLAVVDPEQSIDKNRKQSSDFYRFLMELAENR